MFYNNSLVRIFRKKNPYFFKSDSKNILLQIVSIHIAYVTPDHNPSHK